MCAGSRIEKRKKAPIVFLAIKKYILSSGLCITVYACYYSQCTRNGLHIYAPKASGKEKLGSSL